jgi:hypothetical protein
MYTNKETNMDYYDQNFVQATVVNAYKKTFCEITTLVLPCGTSLINTLVWRSGEVYLNMTEEDAVFYKMGSLDFTDEQGMFDTDLLEDLNIEWEMAGAFDGQESEWEVVEGTGTFGEMALRYHEDKYEESEALQDEYFSFLEYIEEELGGEIDTYKIEIPEGIEVSFNTTTMAD